MLKVGLTGNIGSGKSTVARIFRSMGIPVFEADLEARKLFDRDDIKREIRKLFGIGIFSPSGDILRPKLAEIVFNDQEKLSELNGIIHPAVRADYASWLQNQHENPYSVYEAAILFESGYYKELDKIVCIVAPEELRIRRVLERDKISRQEVERRISNQWPDDKKIELADYIIKNEEKEMLIPQVRSVHLKLLEISEKNS